MSNRFVNNTQVTRTASHTASGTHMINLQTISDKTAIGLSLMCTIHCLALPALVVLLPSLSALPLEDEIFHIWMVVAVIPISAYALTMGCNKHKNYKILAVGIVGLVTLILTAILGHDLLSENLEKTLTVIGALIIVSAHVWNYQLCRHSTCCEV